MWGKSMLYQLCVQLTEQDYLDYNTYVAVRSPYGRRSRRIIWLVMAGLFLLVILSGVYYGDFSGENLPAQLMVMALPVLLGVFMPAITKRSIKAQVKSMKKHGKMGYSPSSVVEFYEDVFVEKTPDTKTELAYTAVERISVVDGRVLYLHLSNVSACILPLSCFASQEQFAAFWAFIQTKCPKVEVI